MKAAAATAGMPQGQRVLRHVGDRLLGGVGLLVMLLALAALAALLYDILHDGLGRISWQFITSYPSRRAEQAGILPALVGSIYVIGITTLIAVPLGVGAAAGRARRRSREIQRH